MIVLEKESAGRRDERLRAGGLREMMKAGEKEAGSRRQLQGPVAREPQEELRCVTIRARCGGASQGLRVETEGSQVTARPPPPTSTAEHLFHCHCPGSSPRLGSAGQLGGVLILPLR